jgi:hypothetical protein
MSKRFSMFLDMMLPNSAWNRRMRTAGPTDRIKYWALRLGLLVFVIVIALLFDSRFNPECANPVHRAHVPLRIALEPQCSPFFRWAVHS